jgi:tetratricopeptide (TPR) repeat protein
MDFHMLGCELLEAGDLEVARDAYRRASGTVAFWEREARWRVATITRDLGDFDGAVDAFFRVMASPDKDDYVIAAAVDLRHLLADAGVDTARQVYGRAIESGDPQLAPAALFGLGDVLQAAGDLDGAQDAYQRAINTAHPRWASFAMLHLGDMHRDQRDPDAARTLYHRLQDAEDPDWKATALKRLQELDDHS